MGIPIHIENPEELAGDWVTDFIKKKIQYKLDHLNLQLEAVQYKTFRKPEKIKNQGITIENLQRKIEKYKYLLELFEDLD